MRWLMKHPIGEEIVARLRHRWAVSEVVDWLAIENRQHHRIDAWLLEAVVMDKADMWYVPVLREGGRRSRLLVLELFEDTIVVQIARVKRFLAMELEMALPVPEVRANIETLHRMLNDLMSQQRAIGLLPTVPTKIVAAMGGEPEGDGMLQFVYAMKETSEENWPALMEKALGPPGGKPSPPPSTARPPAWPTP